ncbi:cytochrome c oxidase assembly protein [Bacterioplanes sanyensis]|uniref:Cytochrome c oxidase assembly protein CtaG n=1 Tax=Bacterioplanes sanyensis TaxID=1249553 RepID=A0A222FLU6_9GAMM|nr:cytochrome c oxidase assembly protein [Bacterioplanes sanyensis]ASP39566.1 cytochrome c oxidase assembly protein [Bacterioplanes sanyensis]
MAQAPDTQQAIQKTVRQLLLVLLGMVGFTIALVPLYDVFCEVTGLNGKPKRFDLADVQAQSLSAERVLDVQFVTKVGTGLPVSFSAAQGRQIPEPGARNQTQFTFFNQGDDDLWIRTVPSISPAEASPHLLKIECFCFQEMLLKAGEKKEVGLMYLVGANLPEHVSSVTLSYTVYPVKPDALAQESSL